MVLDIDVQGARILVEVVLKRDEKWVRSLGRLKVCCFVAGKSSLLPADLHDVHHGEPEIRGHAARETGGQTNVTYTAS